MKWGIYNLAGQRGKRLIRCWWQCWIGFARTRLAGGGIIPNAKTIALLELCGLPVRERLR